ncbi:transmembrane protein 94-like [Gigantopelta aegis]|uniref:transmembrane protein 94-like n=1 Tax=Gigantopelta aegis TaxID=1735272 RepID=UPI001B88C9C9|nr:transmembrane protein 94-like [Gigantopelta aegis]
MKVFRSFHHTVIHSLYHWTTCSIIVILVICLLIAYFCIGDTREGPNTGWWLIEATFLLSVMIFNSTLNLWHSRMENMELITVMKQVIKDVWDSLQNESWKQDDYLNIHSPLSPCVSLQWTMRDGKLINLPVALLVKGDVILLRPGQTVPAKCRDLEDLDETQEQVLMEEEIYSPKIESLSDNPNEPKATIPLKAKKFLLLETPFLKNIRCILDYDLHRTVTMLENEKHLIVRVWLERLIIPLVVGVMTLTNTLRFVYLDKHVGHWAEMIIVLLVHSILPLISLIFPFMWLSLNTYGQARIFAAFNIARYFKQASENSFDSDSTISVEEARVDMTWRNILAWFKDILCGRAQVVTKHSNILHVLESVTSLCCVDKKGVLSWANPSAEKIFFFSQSTKKKPEVSRKYSQAFSPHIEVMDLTHDAKNAFGLHFDDPSWKQHVNSLKPLGLNILLNTCEQSTVPAYTQFSDHVMCAALEKEETVAVVNRRCLCELAREMGFSEQAGKAFSHNEILGMYRQVPAEEAAKERSQRARSFIQHKIPMPNMLSVVVRDQISGMSQFMSQGTADILLESCTDFWTGMDVCLLTENDRKKVLDFYHRNSMTTYCTAFSYRPLTNNIAPSLQNIYIQLPDNNSQLALSITRAQQYAELDDTIKSEFFKLDQRCLSFDSLLETESSNTTIDDVSGCYEIQNNQIFIGMVTLQYQARQDIVQLIDKLESACIRFVHFSKENELRSRVFSEKMGLEAGWNCHVSLVSSDGNNKHDISATSPDDCPSPCDASHLPSHHSSRHHLAEPDPQLDPSRRGSTTVTSEMMGGRSLSAPSMIKVDEPQVRFDVHRMCDKVFGRDVTENCSAVDDQDDENVNGENGPLIRTERKRGWSSSTDGDGDIDGDGDGDGDVEFLSDSRYTSSYVTDNTDSLTGALDNVAKLPRGIENIRPHLRSVDNVPLLVNLFTDCTAKTTREMIKILQEYGEVVLCFGSSMNMQNTPIFLQADCSFAIEPLFPQLCAKHPILIEPSGNDKMKPNQVASALLNIPCPIAFKRRDNVCLVQLIAEARHFTFAMRNCFYLMLCFNLSISLAQMLASVFLLPPILASRHVMWLLLVVVPLLGLSLMGNPVDPRIMNIATRKNKDHVNKQMILQFSVQFALRYFPSVIIPLLCFGLTLHSYCWEAEQHMCDVYIFRDSGNSSSQKIFSSWYEKYSGGLILAQNIVLFLLVLYYACISMSYVHWSDHLWKKPPFTNRLWSIITPTLLVVQIVYFACDTFVQNLYVKKSLPLSKVHPAVWALGLAWPVVIVTVNELVKRREIKLSVRRQKRARLDFGTKLGMNSPW